MKRITTRDEFGNADIVGVDSAKLQCYLCFEEFNMVTFALNRLAAYEDIEMLPKQIKARLSSLGGSVEDLCR